MTTHSKTLYVPTIALLLATAGCIQAGAQQGNAPAKWADTISAEIEAAQVAGDGAKLDAAAALSARVAMAYPNDGLILHYRGYALYRQGIQQMAQGADGSALFVQAQRVLEQSLKTHPLPETHMLLSAIDGQLIAKDMSRAMELGMASQASSSAALSLGPNNPRVWLLRGQGAIFTPPEYGGGLGPAENQLEHAIELFGKDAPKPGEPSWGRAEAYLWLGQVYDKKGDKAKAAELYKQALDIAPGYAYAKALAAGMK
jgi:tetratricopeptide (TPR) repeat protein